MKVFYVYVYFFVFFVFAGVVFIYNPSLFGYGVDIDRKYFNVLNDCDRNSKKNHRYFDYGSYFYTVDESYFNFEEVNNCSFDDIDCAERFMVMSHVFSHNAINEYMAGNDPKINISKANMAIELSSKSLGDDFSIIISKLMVENSKAEMAYIGYESVVSSFEEYIDSIKHYGTIYDCKILVDVFYYKYSESLIYSGEYVKGFYIKRKFGFDKEVY